MDSIAMVYDTETERYVPKWRLEEYPGTSRDFKLLYYSPKRKQYRELDFEGNYAAKRLGFLMDERPEQLEQMLNDGTLYLHLMRIQQKAVKVVWDQIILWEQTDSEFMLTTANGDFLKKAGLLENFKARAEELMYPVVIYV